MPASFASLSSIAPTRDRGLAQAWTSLMQRMERARADRRRVRQLTRELQMCSDLDLRDMGLSRCDIPAVIGGTYSRD